MRRISWVRASEKAFLGFPAQVRERMLFALEIAAAGEMADSAKPLKHIEPGLFEIVIRYRTDAYRTVYAVRLGADIWVIHAFQKKSTKGIATPNKEIDLIRERLKRLKDMVR